MFVRSGKVFFLQDYCFLFVFLNLSQGIVARRVIKGDVRTFAEGKFPFNKCISWVFSIDRNSIALSKVVYRVIYIITQLDSPATRVTCTTSQGVMNFIARQVYPEYEVPRGMEISIDVKCWF